MIREVEFTFAAMTPSVYGTPLQIASMYRGETRVRAGASIAPWSGRLDLCVGRVDEPILDPDCLPLAPLPQVPTIPLGCGDLSAADWSAAYLVEVPGRMLKQWADSVPILSIRSDESIKGVRIRFFPRPAEDWSISDLDPCSACGQFEISYVPPGSIMTIDGAAERVVVEEPGGRMRAAGHLVSSGSNDVPFTWPELACGVGYFVLVESAGASLTGVSLALVTKE